MKSVNIQFELLSLKDDANEGPGDLAGGEYLRPRKEPRKKGSRQTETKPCLSGRQGRGSSNDFIPWKQRRELRLRKLRMNNQVT